MNMMLNVQFLFCFLIWTFNIMFKKKKKKEFMQYFKQITK